MGNKFRLKLSEKHSKYLENLPEQGMGYQLVDIELKSGLKLINRIVINSTLLELNTNEEFWNKDIKELKIKQK
jgi:hypothetical protein